MARAASRYQHALGAAIHAEHCLAWPKAVAAYGELAPALQPYLPAKSTGKPRAGRTENSRSASTPRSPEPSHAVQTLVFEAHYHLSNALDWSGNLLAARRAIDVAVAVAFAHVRGCEVGCRARHVEVTPALLLRAILRAKMGQNDRAMADLTECTIYDPHNADPYCLRALVYKRRGEYLRAVEDCSLVLRRNPDHVAALAIRGWCLRHLVGPPRLEYEEAMGADSTPYPSFSSEADFLKAKAADGLVGAHVVDGAEIDFSARAFPTFRSRFLRTLRVPHTVVAVPRELLEPGLGSLHISGSGRRPRTRTVARTTTAPPSNQSKVRESSSGPRQAEQTMRRDQRPRPTLQRRRAEIKIPAYNDPKPGSRGRTYDKPWLHYKRPKPRKPPHVSGHTLEQTPKRPCVPLGKAVIDGRGLQPPSTRSLGPAHKLPVYCRAHQEPHSALARARQYAARLHNAEHRPTTSPGVMSAGPPTTTTTTTTTHRATLRTLGFQRPRPLPTR